MRLIIDAHIIKGYFQEVTIGNQTFLTGKTIPIFDKIGNEDFVYLDESGHIKSEWQNVVEPEWFDAWYSSLLINGGAYEIPVETCYNLRRKLKSLGFPVDSKDIWYIRTGKATVNLYKNSIILTEDIDFYYPRKKGCDNNTRIEILLSGKGPVSNYLAKKENISICCVENY